jgi:hypothetical protein
MGYGKDFVASRSSIWDISAVSISSIMIGLERVVTRPFPCLKEMVIRDGTCDKICR